MNEEEFQRICLDDGRLLPLQTLTERRRYAEDFRRLSTTQLSAATILLTTDAEQMVVGHAFAAMEAKANELLAWSGYRSKSHLCTVVALSKLLGHKDLARGLQRAYDDRQVYEYTADPRDMESAESFEQLVAVATEFLSELESLIAAVRGPT